MPKDTDPAGKRGHYQLPMESVAGRPAPGETPARERRAGACGKRDLQRCRALLSEEIDDDEWRALFRSVIELVKYGKDMRARVAALGLLLRYQFGVPTHDTEVEVDTEPVRLIEVHLDGSRREIEGWKRDKPKKVDSPKGMPFGHG